MYCWVTVERKKKKEKEEKRFKKEEQERRWKKDNYKWRIRILCIYYVHIEEKRDGVVIYTQSSNMSFIVIFFFSLLSCSSFLNLFSSFSFFFFRSTVTQQYIHTFFHNYIIFNPSKNTQEHVHRRADIL